MPALIRLAGLDSAEVPAGPVMLAEVAGEVRAAVSLSDRTVIADPFHPTAPLVQLLVKWAEQALGERSPRLRRLREPPVGGPDATPTEARSSRLAENRPPDMVAPAIADSDFRELDHRSSDGVHVTLLWSTRTNRVFVSVEDVRTGSSLHFEATPADALDVFHHPYAYAEHQRQQDALPV